MKRYTPEVEPETEWNSAYVIMEEDEDGEYVKTEDYIQYVNRATRLASLLSLEIIGLVTAGKLDAENADALFDIIGDNPVHPNPNPDFGKDLKALVRKISNHE